MNELATVTFNGGEFQTIEVDGVPHVAMRPVVLNLGLNWSGQQQRMLRDERWRCMHVHSPDGRGRYHLIDPEGRPSFAPSSYLNRQGKEQPCFDMDQTGFALLVLTHITPHRAVAL